VLDFDRRPSEPLGILPQVPISLDGNIILIDVMVVEGSLDFDILPRHDYIYDIDATVSISFHVMHFLLGRFN